MILAIDLETTGLDANVHEIIEIGAQLWDDHLTEVRAQFHRLVIPVDRNLDRFILDMHSKSGLLDELKTLDYADPANLWPDVKERFYAWLGEHCPVGEVPIMGNSVGSLDRPFLLRHARLASEWLHYRNIDISSVRELARRWRPDLTPLEPVAEAKHRVISDLADSIALARFYQEHLYEV